MSLLRKFISINKDMSAALIKKYPLFYGTESYHKELLHRIHFNIVPVADYSVLEVGGIDRPLLKKGSGFTYDGLDIESKTSCYDIYDNFFVQSIENKIAKEYDSIISITLLEHVQNNESSFNTIFHALKKSGTTHHYVPSMWHPYAVALRIVGPKLQKRLIMILRPSAVEVSGYPTFFNYCTPHAMRDLLHEIGFTQIDIKPYFRVTGYFNFFVPLFVLITAFENLCKKMAWDTFASGFVISAKKPN